MPHPRILYIDCAPFCGGAQESLWSQMEPYRADAMLVSGAGLWERAVSSGMRRARIEARHWTANMSGLWQLWQDRKKAVPIIRDAIEEFRPEIIHANCIRAAMLLTDLRTPLPVVLHDRDIRAPQLLLQPLQNRLHPMVTAVSRAVAAKWRDTAPPERVRVLPNGFEVTRIAATRRVVLPFRRVENPYCVVLAADFEDWKRHALFLEAVLLAHQRLPSLRAVIKGRVRVSSTGEEDPNSREVLENLFRLIDEHDECRAYLAIDASDGPALPFLAAADTLVSCSENEPFGRTLVEAFALGKTVAATRTGGAPELLDCPAVAVCDDSPEALMEAILAWADPARRQAVAEAARAKAGQYALEKIRPRWDALYAELRESAQ